MPDVYKKCEIVEECDFQMGLMSLSISSLMLVSCFSDD